jgi:hypothetical protein
MFFFVFCLFLFKNTSAQVLMLPDTIFVTYEPYELRQRFPTTVEDIMLYKPSDTITNLNSLFNISFKIDSILMFVEPERSNTFFPKMLIRGVCDGESIYMMYYSSNKILYANGYFFRKDLNLLDLLLSNMHSDDLFIKKYKK